MPGTLCLLLKQGEQYHVFMFQIDFCFKEGWITDMINLIHSELYKLRKSRSFRVAGGLAVLFTMIVYLMYELLRNNMVEGLDAAAAEAVFEVDILQILREMFANSNTIIFVTVFVCLFVLGDHTGGAIKNFVGKGFRREEIYLARFLVTEFGAVMIYLLTALAVFSGGLVFFGTEQINGTMLYDFASYLSLHILYLTGYTAIIIMACEMTRNMMGILISILGVLLLSNVLLEGIDIVIRALGMPFAISKYWILTVIRSCPVTDIPARFVTGSGIITGVWLIAALAAGMLYFSRKDVK